MKNKRLTASLLFSAFTSTAPSETAHARNVLVVRRQSAALRACPSASCALLGVAHLGARLTVMDDGAAPTSEEWEHVLGNAFIQKRSLAVLEAAAATLAEEPREGYQHVRVLTEAAPVYALPRRGARIMAHEPRGRVLAISELASAGFTGWYARAHGGYVQGSDVRLLRPSGLVGVENPERPLAFAVSVPGLPRYTRSPVLELSGRMVKTEAGVWPRRSVRLFVPPSRPKGIPENARWVHINLREQVLTAYEGDRPVFTTLVSTGKPSTPTSRGVFRVTLKSVHDRMHGEGYDVEEVPFILYFNRGEGLHGAFWHDHFGQAVTHGCVNLSPMDGQRLFEWAPPPLPPGWHSLIPRPGDSTLLVWVENGSADERLRRRAVPRVHAAVRTLVGGAGDARVEVVRVGRSVRGLMEDVRRPLDERGGCSFSVRLGEQLGAEGVTDEEPLHVDTGVCEQRGHERPVAADIEVELATVRPPLSVEREQVIERYRASCPSIA